jgi:hypothetical protein
VGARAAAGGGPADADGVGKETSRRATKTVADDVTRDETGEEGSESSESSESESESMGESSDASAVDPEDLPSRLIGMLDVERPAW